MYTTELNKRNLMVTLSAYISFQILEKDDGDAIKLSQVNNVDLFITIKYNIHQISHIDIDKSTEIGRF